MFKEKLKSIATKKMAIYIFIALTIRWGAAEAYRVPSESMNPTLKPGDMIFVNKAQYGIRVPFTNHWLIESGDVEKGDVIVFRYPKEESTFYVKRVIGTPGDRIFINSDGKLFINDHLQIEDYLSHNSKKEKASEGLYPFGPVTVPEGQLFVLGDNRENSSDSRVWGYVPKKLLMGKVAFKWFSWVD